MNKLFLFICLFSSLSSYSQIKGNYRGADGVPYNHEYDDATGGAIRIGDHSNIGGSPFLQTKWMYGVVMLKNGNTFFDSLINYSLFNNKLFTKKNGNIYEINAPIREFSIVDSQNLNEQTFYHFRNGFPAIAENDSSTFYQILFPGNSLMLLKREHKKVTEKYRYSETYQSEYTSFRDYFAFYPRENKMVELGIRVKTNVLRKNLPLYANQIDTYTSYHTLKNETDLILLFLFLDVSKQ